ncbi:MAG: hypothetical protein IJQ94_05730 [Bacteroidales bacterium]|nr:hypothetical protein [Bacteroidales bacterium]
MKKLFILMAATCCLAFTACNNNKPAEQPAENTEMQAEDHPCCKDMTPEQKAEMEAHKKACEDWKNWENITEERRVELLNQRKADYDKMQEMKKAQEEKKAKFEAAMNNWDNLTTAEKKAAFDEMGCCGGCKKGEGPGCCKGGDKPGCPEGGPHHGPKGPCPKDHKCPKGEPKN